ncbi:DoxX family protein [Chitinophaga silvatica]|uniref:DoxX family protein n=1 Tax=Chitinophaga silvatica TaxID=2282649 RepID=A0A3E1Y3F0_9BACT|nr:DoxX family protein [Chitinophaga silvatica]RFS19172.1 DoxX family protein [Chitinophaga silvatica]
MSNNQKILFKVVFVYFLLQALPLDWKFYQTLFSINLLHLQYEDIFNLANYTTRFSKGPATFEDWGILFLISILIVGIWTFTKRTIIHDYDKAFYWLRTILRYRVALALLTYGFLKFFVLQSPYPSISSLNTPYGEFNRWKLFSLSLGIVPSYELFLGLVEIILAGLLIYRKTASIAAFIILVYCGNIFVSNVAYEGGEVVYSLLLITYALVIISPDLERIIRLILFQQPAKASTFKPVYNRRILRIVLKGVFVLFFVLIYGVKTGISAKSDPYQYPTVKGLKDAAGLYNVSTFIRNGDTLSYSLSDTVRWRNVVFEEWNTISILTNLPAPINTNNEHLVTTNSQQRLYETEGTNGRHYYTYKNDEAEESLHLVNRLPGLQSDKFTLHYFRPDSSTIILNGVSPANDTIQVVLTKLNKAYLLEEARGKSRNRKLKL